eukprot:m.57628 g.57628  ORF g.57628 m.57628 type:complete len:750 (+) comp11121_c0_seq1:236-2485(+)
MAQKHVRALYDTGGDESSSTPPLRKGELLILHVVHPNGWLEIETSQGQRGYVSPAWVEPVEDETASTAVESSQKDTEVPPAPQEDYEDTNEATVVSDTQTSQPIPPVEDYIEPEKAVDEAPAPNTDLEEQQNAQDQPSIPEHMDSVASTNSNPDLDEIPEASASPKSRKKSMNQPKKVNAFAAQLDSLIGGGGFLPGMKPPPRVGRGPPPAPENKPAKKPPPTIPRRDRSTVESEDPQPQIPPPEALDEDSNAMEETVSEPPKQMEEMQEQVSEPPPQSEQHKPPPRAAPPQPPVRIPSVPAASKPVFEATTAIDEVEEVERRPTQSQKPSRVAPPPPPTHKAPPKPPAAQPKPKEPVIMLGHEGVLERKPLLEGGQSFKKSSWHKHYVVLAGQTLYFYKDKKEKEKGKKALFFLSLRDMKVSPSSETTKKKFCFELGHSVEKVALQAPDESAMYTWMSILNTALTENVVQAPHQAPVAFDPPPQQQTQPPAPKPNPPVVRSQNQTVRVKDSNEKRNWGPIRSTMNRFLRSRPAKEELKQKGIITDVVFGGTIAGQVQLEDSLPIEDKVPGVPLVVSKCVSFVDGHLREQGIYRVSGNNSLIQKLSLRCNEDVTTFDLTTNDIHAVTGLLKLYFRELTEPVFTDELYPSFMVTAKISDRTARLQQIKELVQKLPQAHKTTLKYLCTHLNRVAAESQSNKMRPNNLAIVFGPTLLRRSSPTTEMIVMDAPFQATVVEEILQQLDWVLDDV